MRCRMREILFRGKRVDNVEWMEGFYAVSGDRTYIIFDSGIAFGYVTMKEVIPETVGQYTGLTDKNGKKIFECDVIRDKYGIIFEIMFSDNGYFVAINDDYWEFINDLDEIKVLGNIHDNGEILEVEND